MLALDLLDSAAVAKQQEEVQGKQIKIMIGKY